MKKRIIIILCIVLIIFFILISIIIKNKNTNTSKTNDIESTNTINLENKIQLENASDYEKNVSENTDITNNIQNEDESKIESEDTDIKSSLPSDVGLTINGVHKTFNQDIMSQANIAYLLGCDNITDTSDLELYIANHIPNNGIFISEKTVYQKTNNPYDYIKERKTIMKENLSEINLIYDIDKNNYLIDNHGNGELEQKLNKLISGDKKIIIGFVAEYYTYINDSKYGLQLGGGFMNSSYVSFKPYNNIYTYIFDENSSNMDDFHNMIEEISRLAD